MQDSASGAPGFSTFHGLADYARANPDTSLVVSSEFMSAWPRTFTQDTAEALKGLDVTVIAYIRDYGEWLASSYGFDVIIGWNAGDFDRYFEAADQRVSYWPVLESWADEFGWENLRVRSLDPRSLQGGDLLGDCLHAVGLDPALAGVSPRSRRNASPSWMAVEMTRTLVEDGRGSRWETPMLELAGFLRQELEHCIGESPNGALAAQYLTPAQARSLGERFNADVARIVDKTGAPIPLAAVPELAPRPFLPSVSTIPADILSAFLDRMTSDAGREALDRLAAAEGLTARLEQGRTVWLKAAGRL